MRSKLTLLTTAAALAFGLSATAALAEDAPGAKGDAPGAHSDITIVGTDTGDAPSGAEQGTEAPGAADQGSADVPDDSGAGGAAIQARRRQVTRAARALLANPQRISVHRLPSPL